MSILTDPDPRAVARRDARLAALGPQPVWWRLFGRAQWKREHRRIMSYDVSRATEWLRAMYPVGIVAELAARLPVGGAK